MVEPPVPPEEPEEDSKSRFLIIAADSPSAVQDQLDRPDFAGYSIVQMLIDPTSRDRRYVVVLEADEFHRK